MGVVVLELGILADDLTGGMMVASLLEAEGIRCPLVSSVEALAEIDPTTAEAVVVARKIRLIEPDLAVLEAQAVVAGLQKLGIQRSTISTALRSIALIEAILVPSRLRCWRRAADPRRYFAPLFRGIRLLSFRAGCSSVQPR